MPNHLARPTDTEKSFMQANIAQLKRMQSFALAKDIPFVVVLMPDENQLNPALQSSLIPDGSLADYDFEMPQAALRPLFEREQINYVDLLPDFQSDQRCLYMDDTHWITAGHEFAAQRIADFLNAGAYLPH